MAVKELCNGPVNGCTTAVLGMATMLCLHPGTILLVKEPCKGPMIGRTTGMAMYRTYYGNVPTYYGYGRYVRMAQCTMVVIGTTVQYGNVPYYGMAVSVCSHKKLYCSIRRPTCTAGTLGQKPNIFEHHDCPIKTKSSKNSADLFNR